MQPWIPSAVSPANLDSSDNLKAPPAFLDPLRGGYTIEAYGSDTANPFYYDAGELAGSFRPCQQGSVGIPVETANQLRFMDCPANRVYWPLTVTTNFTTSLVGVLPSGLPSAPLFTWTWQSNFNGDAGGVSQTKSIFPIDPTSGTGAVTTSSINGVLLPPAVPSSQVATTASGLAYSRVSQTFDGTVTLSNISTGAISGPLQILFTGMAAGVTRVNATGDLSGTPYLTVPAVASLAAGRSVTVSVQFKNPSSVTMSFTPAIYSGSIN
jgi:hypothetical protein